MCYWWGRSPVQRPRILPVQPPSTLKRLRPRKQPQPKNPWLGHIVSTLPLSSFSHPFSFPTPFIKMGFFSNSSGRSAKHPSVPNPLIAAYTHLDSMPRADEALKILYQLASFVKPIMLKRNWKVGTLAEFLPEYHALQGFLHPSALF